MRCIAILSVFLLLSLFAFSRDKKDKNAIATAEVIVGSNYITKQPLKALQYTFPFNIHSYSIDSAGRNIVLLLQDNKKNRALGVNYFVHYDMSRHVIRWVKEVYLLNAIFSENYIVYNDDRTSYCLDRSSGQQLWEANDLFIPYIDDQSHKGIATNGKGIDMRSGQILWDRKFRQEYRWDDVKKVNDSIVILATHGLHCINLNTGKGFYHEDETQVEDYAPVIAIGAALIGAGIVTGTFLVPAKNTVKPYTIRGLTSQILTDGETVLFATKTSIVCINYITGRKIWGTRLRANETGSSILELWGDKVVLVNEGVAYTPSGSGKKFGKPYIAAFNRSNGTELYWTSLEENKDDKVLDVFFNGNVVLLLFPGNVRQYDMENGSKTAHTDHISRQNEYYSGFIDPRNVYIRNEQPSFKQLSSLHPLISYSVYTTSGNVEGFDLKLNKQVLYSPKEVSVELAREGNISLVKNTGSSSVVRGQQVVGEVNFEEGFLVDKVLYSIKRDTFTTLDVYDLYK